MGALWMSTVGAELGAGELCCRGASPPGFSLDLRRKVVTAQPGVVLPHISKASPAVPPFQCRPPRVTSRESHRLMGLPLRLLLSLPHLQKHYSNLTEDKCGVEPWGGLPGIKDPT